MTCKPFTVSCGSILANGIIEVDYDEGSPTSRNEMMQRLTEMMSDKSIGKKPRGVQFK